MPFSYQLKGDHLTIFKNKKKMHTPKGNIIYTYDEAFAKRIIKELEAEADYTSCASILCYHYTYCDLTAEYDQKTVAEDLLTCLENNVEYDPIIALNEAKEIEAMSDEEVDQLVKTFKPTFSLSLNSQLSTINYRSYRSFEDRIRASQLPQSADPYSNAQHLLYSQVPRLSPSAMTLPSVNRRTSQ